MIKKWQILSLVLMLLLGAASWRAAHLHNRSIDIPEKTETTAPQGLNHLIDNSLSNLDETKRFERDITMFMQRWAITGASVAVMKDGNLLYRKGFGMADTLSGEPMETSHIMRIASLSKLITATAIMKLREQGLLHLGDKVFGEEGILNDSIYTSSIKDRQIKDITVEHLLRHRGGFSLLAGDPLFSPEIVSRSLGCPQPIDARSLMIYAASTRLRYRPGGSNIYSNLGYVILSQVIERVSGMPYETYVKKNILDPTGCTDMYIGRTDPAAKYPNEVSYYEPHDADSVRCYDGSGRMVARRYGGCDIELLSGAGGWTASATELLKLITAIDYEDSKPDILSRESIDIMTADSDDEFPIGWARVRGDGSWSRTGSLAGTSALIKRQSNGYTWTFITNASSWSGSRFPRHIDGMMHDAIAKVKEWPERDLFDGTHKSIAGAGNHKGVNSPLLFTVKNSRN